MYNFKIVQYVNDKIFARTGMLRLIEIKSEMDVMHRHQFNMKTKDHVRLWRNNVGVFFTKNGRSVRTGLCAGSADLIGFESVVVTQEMVGKRVAIFRADEIKYKTHLSDMQREWLTECKDMGAIVNVVRESDV